MPPCMVHQMQKKLRLWQGRPVPCSDLSECLTTSVHAGGQDGSSICGTASWQLSAKAREAIAAIRGGTGKAAVQIPRFFSC